MFSAEFRGTSQSAILDAIKANGYFAAENVLSAEALERMDQEVGPMEVTLNKNHVPAVVYKNQRYLTHCLAHSRTIYELMTCDELFSIMRGYFREQFRLTDQRVYVTEAGEKMQWHVDNKLDSSVQTGYPGLIFIFYLCDVTDGQFQIVKNSHCWSRSHAQADFLDSSIESVHKDDIVDFKMPKGSAIIYTTDMVHRAAPVRNKGWERKSLFFQVERKEQGGEPILVNTSFLGELSHEKKFFLGFGAVPEYQIYPQTDISTMKAKQLLSMAAKCFSSSFRAVLMNRVWTLSPDSRFRLRHILQRQGTVAKGR